MIVHFASEGYRHCNDLNVKAVCKKVLSMLLDLYRSGTCFRSCSFMPMFSHRNGCVFVCHDKLKMMEMDNLIGVI